MRKSFRRKASSLTATHPLPPLRGTKRKETHHEKTNQRPRWPSGWLVVVVAALLAIFNQSRTFAQTMGQDYDPGQVQAIHVALYAPDDAQSRQVTLSPTDPAAQELLTLLGSQMYDVVYSLGTVSGGYSAPYGYLANLAIRLPEKGTGYSWASITLSGEPQLQISGPYQPGYQTYRADPAVQKAIMDLLLAQPYETIPAT